MKKAGGTILFLSLFIFLFSYCNSEIGEKETEKSEELVWLNHHDSVKYVGMQTCKQCHADKHETFIHTGMGLSFDSASQTKSAANFHGVHPVYDEHLNFYYLPFWSDNTLCIKEFRLDGRDTVYQRIQKVDYIVGSGQHTNSHIYSNSGYLYQAPLTWYVQEAKWDLPPGFENGANTRFNRIIGMECMSCHNALPQFDTTSLNRFTKVPDGIDCERCHGPGELHVKEKRAGKLVDITKETDYTIVNPAKLSWELQVDLCQRCHLQGNAILVEGKHFDDFKPGMRLKDFMNVFMPKYEGREDEFIMASHAQRLQMSQCFIKSNQGDKEQSLTCINCHNPHISVKVTGKKVFNDACISCHQEKKCTESIEVRNRVNDNCTSCHMPSNGTEDIPHVSVHDHFIRVPKGINANQDKIFKGLYAVNNDNPDRITLARAYISYFEKFDRKPQYLDSAQFLLSSSSSKKHLIHLYYLKNEYAKIISLLEEKEPFDDALTNYRIGRAYAELDKPLEAESFLSIASQKMPNELSINNELAVTYLKNNKTKEASDLLERLLKLNPNQAITLNNRGYIYFLESNLIQAKKNYEKALSLNPDYVPAIRNLIDLNLRVLNKQEAKKLAFRWQKLEPDNQTVIKLLQDLEP